MAFSLPHALGSRNPVHARHGSLVLDPAEDGVPIRPERILEFHSPSCILVCNLVEPRLWIPRSLGTHVVYIALLRNIPRSLGTGPTLKRRYHHSPSFKIPDMAGTDATSLWVCNGIAFGLFFARLILRKVKGQRFNAGDYWTMSASVFLIVRVVVSHYILLHGTTTSE